MNLRSIKDSSLTVAVMVFLTLFAFVPYWLWREVSLATPSESIQLLRLRRVIGVMFGLLATFYVLVIVDSMSIATDLGGARRFVGILFYVLMVIVCLGLANVYNFKYKSADKPSLLWVFLFNIVYLNDWKNRTVSKFLIGREACQQEPE